MIITFVQLQDFDALVQIYVYIYTCISIILLTLVVYKGIIINFIKKMIDYDSGYHLEIVF